VVFAVDLGQTGQAGFDLETFRITGNRLLKLGHKLGPLRAGTNQTHGPVEDVEELRDFVNPGRPQQTTNRRHPAVIRAR